MDKISEMDDAQFIFGTILVVSNKMDTMLERALEKHNITTKQWFLSVAIYNLFDEPPTIKEVAKAMGSSHQNIKQVALKLEDKGFLVLKKDKNDARVTRLVLTEKSFEFWKKVETEGRIFTDSFFKGIDKVDLSKTRIVLSQMLVNLEQLGKS